MKNLILYALKLLGPLLLLATPTMAQTRITLESGDHFFMLVKDLADRKAPYKFVYMGDFMCSATMMKASSSRYMAVSHGRGFRLDGQFVYPCDDVIRQNSNGFLGKRWGWELDNGEWRFQVDLNTRAAKVYFRGKLLGSGTAEFEE